MRLLVAQAEPVVGGIGLAGVGQVGLAPGRRRRTGSRASRPRRAAGPSPSSAATGTPRCWPSRSSSADSIAVTAWIVVRRSKVCWPRPPASRSANCLLHLLQQRAGARRSAGRRRAARASSSVWRIFSPPGTSPTPVRPALSVRISRLRVKNGPCAPLRLSSMLSRPATGITRSPVSEGVGEVGAGMRWILERSWARSIRADLPSGGGEQSDAAASAPRRAASSRSASATVPREA